MVPFDRQNIGAGAQQCARQATGAGADFIDILSLERSGDGGNAVEQLFVEQEILTECFAGRQAMAGDNIPKRGQCGKGHAASAAWRLSAAISAILMAAIIEWGIAMFWPAMPKAVPWSGDVRTTGRPSVMLTASWK